MNKELYFPTPIYIKDIGTPEFNNDLEKNIINWSNQDKGVTRTNMNGWHSQDDMHTKYEYKKLVDILYLAQNDIYKEELLDNEPFLGNMWANINPPGGYNRPHTHPNSLWSGVYYVKTPKDCGSLKCEDPKPSLNISRPKRKEGDLPLYLWNEVHFEPVAGRLIMFPAYLNHCVEPNKSNDIRISVSFNFLQKGMFV
tara:strand:+ start:1539 stop:2129 length:591 start_codon:yes stop_codon:yes gene_type:complete